MSESDDTDVLLLIPPDYFLADASSNEGSVTDILSLSSNNERGKDLLLQHSLISHQQNINENNKYCIVNKNLKNSADITSKNYTIKPNNSDESTSYILKMDGQSTSQYNSPLKYCEFNSQNKYALNGSKFPESQILLEIDNFLHEGKSLDDSICLENSIIDVQGMTFKDLQPITENDIHGILNPSQNKQIVTERTAHCSSSQQTNFKIPSDRRNQDLINIQKYSDILSMNAFNHMQSEKGNELLSLNEMWGPDSHTNDNLSLKEERLKREVCIIIHI